MNIYKVMVKKYFLSIIPFWETVFQSNYADYAALWAGYKSMDKYRFYKNDKLVSMKKENGNRYLSDIDEIRYRLESF
jgi:hypothetical protein